MPNLYDTLGDALEENAATSAKLSAVAGKTYKGTTYWPSFREARDYARRYGHPEDRIIHYGRGYAIQLYVSGPYVNANDD